MLFNLSMMTKKVLETLLRYACVPPGRKGKQVPVRIGVYVRGFGQRSLKQAWKEWEPIRAWRRDTGRNLRDLKK